MTYSRIIYILVTALSVSCGRQMGSELSVSEIPSQGSIQIKAEAWSDNWFAFYLGDELVVEDSVSITTERSFNAESFIFNADFPLQLNFVLKDFKENDSGLEYIGARNQQMGDGSFIVQFVDVVSDELVAYSNDSWKCLVIHDAPLDKSCENSDNPIAGEGACNFISIDEPVGWKSTNFDDSNWPNAIQHSAAAIDPKGGYDQIDWQSEPELIWSADLETHNTLLCRATISQ